MRIIVTGATGVVGRAAVPGLVAAGHQVVGLHRRPGAGSRWLDECGSEPVLADLFDPGAVRAVVRGADAVVHLATAIPPLGDFAKRRAWAANDRLRVEATRVLADAVLAGDAAVFVVASITFGYADGGAGWIDEDHPVDARFAPTASAGVAEAEVARVAASGRRGVVLRLSQLYGPGRASAELVEALRARRVPLVGPGANFVSSLHAHDAGTAVVAALDAPSGRYNVSDDGPVTAAERLALQACEVGAPTPRRVPKWLARLALGAAAHQLTVSHRILNRRFRQTTGWTPQYPNVLEGWPTVARHHDPDRTIGA